MLTGQNGVLLVDKSSGPSSFEVVRLVRKNACMSRVGHAGTLDPLAEGLLAVCLGEGCKLVPFLQDAVKQYEVRIALGTETLTLDWEGEVTRREAVPPIDTDMVEAVFPQFVGLIHQIPPIFSAVKKDGEKLYIKARRGETVTPDPRAVQIDSISLVGIDNNLVSLVVDCRKGTYIRSLARDIAHALGTVGTVDALRRTACSGFVLNNTISVDALGRGMDISPYIIPMHEALPLLPKLVIDGDKEIFVRNGNPIPAPETHIVFPDPELPLVGLLSEENKLIAIARQQENGLQPIRVMLEG